MIYSHTSDIKLSWDETVQCVIAQGTGYRKNEKAKESLNKVLELLKEKKASKLITDMTQVAPFGKEIQTWIVKDWVPRMIAAGLKTQAFVIPKSGVTRLIMNETAQRPPFPGLEVAFFDSQEAAKEWLLSR